MSRQSFRERSIKEKELQKAHERLLELEDQKFRNSNRIEVFKAINGISLFGIKFLMVLNGGAAAAVISFASKAIPANGNGQALSESLQAAVVCYVVGLVLSAAALLLGWQSQIRLFQQWSGSSSKEAVPSNTRFLFVSMIGSGILAVAFFFWGSLEAIGFETFGRSIAGWLVRHA